MIIKPKVRDFICTTAHPDGCKENIREQIDYIKQEAQVIGPQKVLVIGSSTGYGLATRIAATYGCGASTIGVMFEREATGKRTATPGWYNTKAFESFAQEDGYYAKTINGDAYSNEVKEQVIDLIKADFGQVDMVIYSLASPRRTVADGTTYHSVLKTTEGIFENKSLNLRDNTIGRASIGCATAEETADTIKVMGGEDWKEWMLVLNQAGVLAKGVTTLAYSYIGPELTYPVYFNGTIGKAKEHLYQTSIELNELLKEQQIKAYISVNKALVTQSSSAIPVVPLYMAILYKIMKKEGVHEDCIAQMNRLFKEKLQGEVAVDEMNRIRLDDYEMSEKIQTLVMQSWDQVNTENLKDYADIDGYWDDFYHMFGFNFDGVDYDKDVDLLKGV